MILSREEDYGDGKHHGGPGMQDSDHPRFVYRCGSMMLPLHNITGQLEAINVDELAGTISFTVTYVLGLADVKSAKNEQHQQVMTELEQKQPDANKGEDAG